jgi:hypothetical protein
MLGLAAPIAIAAAMPVRGEPAYRWLVRAVRHRRGRRFGTAVLEQPDKSEIRGPEDTGAAPAVEAGGATWHTVHMGEAAPTAVAPSEHLPWGAGDGRTAHRDESPITAAPLLRPHLVRPD